MAEWLEVRCSLPDRRPLLVEHRSAYTVFDDSQSPPRLIVAIGGNEKRSFLQCTRKTSFEPSHGIALHAFSPATVIADCELDAIREIPLAKSQRRTTEHIHQLSHLPPITQSFRITRLAHELYWQSLAPFSCIMLLFAQDFAGVGSLIDILSLWVQQSMSHPLEVPPRILLVCNAVRKKSTLVIKRLRSRLRTVLKRYAPGSETSDAAVDSYLRKAFESIRFLSNIDADTLHAQVEEASVARELSGFMFSATHLKSLIPAAIDSFSRQPGQAFSVYNTSRLQNPVPPDLCDHLSEFVNVSKGSDAEVVAILASALEFNAYPPGMPCM